MCVCVCVCVTTRRQCVCVGGGGITFSLREYFHLYLSGTAVISVIDMVIETHSLYLSVPTGLFVE